MRWPLCLLAGLYSDDTQQCLFLLNCCLSPDLPLKFTAADKGELSADEEEGEYDEEEEAEAEAAQGKKKKERATKQGRKGKVEIPAQGWPR